MRTYCYLDLQNQFHLTIMILISHIPHKLYAFFWVNYFSVGFISVIDAVFPVYRFDRCRYTVKCIYKLNESPILLLKHPMRGRRGHATLFSLALTVKNCVQIITLLNSYQGLYHIGIQAF